MAKAAPVLDWVAPRLVFAPFVVPALLAVTGLFGTMTGFYQPGPSNGFAAFGLIATALGLVLGVVGLFLGWGRWKGVTLLLAALYVPVAILCPLSVGL